jgi:chromatin segregation and condensation protein Rec8/ScpA/Scc1 (kleisin family)
MFAPKLVPPKESVFISDEYCSLQSLREAIGTVLSDLPKKETKVKATVKAIISLEEMMVNLEGRIRENLQIRFSELHKGETERKVVIVGFLAILELFKQGNLIIDQAGQYADIVIVLDQGVTPSYY